MSIQENQSNLIGNLEPQKCLSSTHAHICPSSTVAFPFTGSEVTPKVSPESVSVFVDCESRRSSREGHGEDTEKLLQLEASCGANRCNHAQPAPLSCDWLFP